MQLPHSADVIGVNTSARFALIARGPLLTTFTPHDERLVTHQLPHDVQRFTHHGPVTHAIGTGGVSVLLGHTLLSSTVQPGPHAVIGGALQPPTLTPDAGGLRLTPDLAPAYAGAAVTGGLYRGSPLLLFSGPLLSRWAGVDTWRSYTHPRTFSDVYTHPHLRFVATATPEGLLYSVDDTRSWQLEPLGGWPLRFGPGDTWVVRGDHLDRA